LFFIKQSLGTDKRQESKIESSSHSLMFLFLGIFNEKWWFPHYGSSRISGTIAFDSIVANLLFLHLSGTWVKDCGYIKF
jgi:hypothetical protein